MNLINPNRVLTAQLTHLKDLFLPTKMNSFYCYNKMLGKEHNILTPKLATIIGLWWILLSTWVRDNWTYKDRSTI